MPPRLEERIRDLCTRVIAADETELEAAILELQTALHEHVEQLRQLVLESHLKSLPGTPASEQTLP